MKLIIGLGNPGRKYEDTRHSIGFKIVSALADKYKIRLNTKVFNSLIGKGRIFSEDVLMALPHTYMNRSGEAVRMIVARRKAKLEDLLVVCDDADLSLGVIRIRPSGSSGGHKGLQSIIEHLDSGDFARLRIGIGKPRPCTQERGRDAESAGLSGHVLSPFKKNEGRILDSVVKSAVECCEVWIKEGAERAANRFNLKNRKD